MKVAADGKSFSFSTGWLYSELASFLKAIGKGSNSYLSKLTLSRLLTESCEMIAVLTPISSIVPRLQSLEQKTEVGRTLAGSSKAETIVQSIARFATIRSHRQESHQTPKALPLFSIDSSVAERATAMSMHCYSQLIHQEKFSCVDVILNSFGLPGI